VAKTTTKRTTTKRSTKVSLRREAQDSVQVALRLPAEWVARLDALARALSVPGLAVSSSDAMRVAMARGMAELEAERGLVDKPKPTKGGAVS